MSDTPTDKEPGRARESDKTTEVITKLNDTIDAWNPEMRLVRLRDAISEFHNAAFAARGDLMEIDDRHTLDRIRVLLEDLSYAINKRIKHSVTYERHQGSNWRITRTDPLSTGTWERVGDCKANADVSHRAEPTTETEL